MNITDEEMATYRQHLLAQSVPNVELHNIPEGVILPGEFLFKLKDTHGLPLTFGVLHAMDRGYFILWPSYIKAALSHGHKIDRVCAQITEAISDAGYVEYAKKTFGVVG